MRAVSLDFVFKNKFLALMTLCNLDLLQILSFVILLTEILSFTASRTPFGFCTYIYLIYSHINMISSIGHLIKM